MARRLTQKEMKHDEFVDGAADFGHWLEKNWTTVAQAAAGLLVVAALVVGFFWYASHNREQARVLLAQGMQRYQQAELAGFADASQVEEALGFFEQSADRSSGSPAGQTARFYRGAALYHLGRLDEAVGVLDELQGADLTPTLRGSARILLAETVAEQGDTERAIALLEEIAADTESAFPPDQALLRLGHLQRRLGNEAEAKRIWEGITRDYPQSAGAAEAGRLLVSP